MNSKSNNQECEQIQITPKSYAYQLYSMQQKPFGIIFWGLSNNLSLFYNFEVFSCITFAITNILLLIQLFNYYTKNSNNNTSKAHLLDLSIKLFILLNVMYSIIFESTHLLSRTITALFSTIAFLDKLSTSTLFIVFSSSIITLFRSFNLDTGNYQLSPLLITLTLATISKFIQSLPSQQTDNENSQNKTSSEEVLSKKDNKESSFVLKFCSDLLNPIHCIQANLGLIKEEFSQKSNNLISTCEHSLELLLNSLNNILDSAKIQENQLEISKTQTNSRIFFEKVWANCSRIIQQKEQIVPKIQIDKDVPEFIEIDEQKTSQMIFNLVQNSVKFTHMGSIKLSVGWKLGNTPQEIIENINSDSDSDDSSITSSILSGTPSMNNDELPSVLTGALIIKIKDSGSGISQKTLNSISSMNQLEIKTNSIPSIDLSLQNCCSSNTNSCENTKQGMGLWVTKSIVSKLEGQMLIQSKYLQGTSVTIAIPCQTDQTINKYQFGRLLMAKKNSMKFQRSNMKALIIEDSSINQLIHKEFLKRCGFTNIECANNGQEALEIIQQNVNKGKDNYFDVICSDIDMPIMNGKDCVTEIRKFETKNSLPSSKIVFISGNCIDSEVQSCLAEEGLIRADCFLRKPASLEQFREAIKRTLN